MCIAETNYLKSIQNTTHMKNLLKLFKNNSILLTKLLKSQKESLNKISVLILSNSILTILENSGMN